MKQKLLQSLPYTIVALIIYLVLLLIFHKEYTYIYTEWFVDEWIVVTIGTLIYIILIFVLGCAIRFIISKEDRTKRFALTCLSIGVVIAVVVGMKKYTDMQEEEHQRQLDIANDAAETIKQQQKQAEQEKWKIYKEVLEECQK